MIVLGLRARVIVAFVLVALVSGAAVAGASYREARNILLEKTQTKFAETMRNDLERIVPQLQHPPSDRDMVRVARTVGGLARYGNRQVNAEGVRLDIPPEMLRAVQDPNRDRMILQRVVLNETPYVLVGTKLKTMLGQNIGIEVYGVLDLVQEQESIDRLARNMLIILAVALLLAIALALATAGGVLRPVRRLRQGVRQVAAGRLDTRLPARGSDELAELVRTFNTMAAELERNVDELRRMDANSRRFVADVSHELRTPLTAMTAVTEALDEEALRLDSDAAIAAGMVSAETRKLRQLVENLIEISRFDAGGAALRLEPVDVAAAVSASLAARGWTEEVTANLPAGVVAELDRRRFDVIMANLVGNALKHGASPVTVEVRTEAGHVIVTVTDSGPGLAPEILPHVFERFYKADSARARSEGSGLGLAIAWENARLHGGVLEAGNTPGRGARFTLRLPTDSIGHDGENA